MKTLPPLLAAHTVSGSTTLGLLLRITRSDGEVYGFTSDAQDVLIDGVVYQAARGLSSSTIETSAGLSVDNLELIALADGATFVDADVLAGRWDNATYWLGRYNTRAPSDGVEDIQEGTTGEVRLHNGRVVGELRGPQQRLQQPIGEVTSKTCRYRLGDARCGVDLGPVTRVGAITNVTNKQSFADAGLGGDADFANVSLLLHGNGANGGTTFTDSSSYGHTMTAVGAPVTSTAWSQFGGASMYFNGSSNLVSPTHASLQFSGDLTISLFLRSTVPDHVFVVRWGSNPNSANGGGLLIAGGVMYLYLNAGFRITGPSISNGTTYYVEITRTGAVWRMYVNGVSYGAHTNAMNISEGIISLAASYTPYTASFTGYIDELRVTQGLARTAAVPVVEYPSQGLQHPSGWFEGGVLTFNSGANINLSQKIKAYDTEGVFTLILPMILPVNAGDEYTAVAGCNKRFDEDCVGKHSNGRRFGGEPHVTGLDAMMKPAS